MLAEMFRKDAETVRKDEEEARQREATRVSALEADEQRKAAEARRRLDSQRAQEAARKLAADAERARLEAHRRYRAQQDEDARQCAAEAEARRQREAVQAAAMQEARQQRLEEALPARSHVCEGPPPSRPTQEPLQPESQLPAADPEPEQMQCEQELQVRALVPSRAALQAMCHALWLSPPPLSLFRRHPSRAKRSA